MSFPKHFGLVLAILFATPAGAMAESASMTVSVKNLSPPTGSVEISLFDSQETYMKETLRQQSGKSSESGEYETVFNDLTPGDYAVVVVHDANDNGKLDTGFLGFGGENYGFSNQASSWFGRPDYEEAKITVEVSGTQVDIDLK